MSKNVKIRRRVSHVRDRDFYRDFQLNKWLARNMRMPKPSVYVAQGLGGVRSLPPQPKTNKLRPAPWRDIEDRTRLLFIQRELSKRGSCMTFNLNLSHEVIEDANANPTGFMEYVRRRITHHMEVAIGKAPDFWFVIEKTKNGQPHLHGALVVDPTRYKAIRMALRKAGGKWVKTKERAYQLRMQNISYPDGWVEYAMKGFAHYHFGITAVGYATTRSLTKAATVAYESARKVVLAVRLKPSAVQV